MGLATFYPSYSFSQFQHAPARRGSRRERGLQQVAAVGASQSSISPAANTPGKRRIMKPASSSSKTIPPAVEIARAIGLCR